MPNRAAASSRDSRRIAAKPKVTPESSVWVLTIDPEVRPLKGTVLPENLDKVKYKELGSERVQKRLRAFYSEVTADVLKEMTD
jgi:hypothetical protein